MGWFQLVVVFACLALGGLIKGATGAGAPLLAVPALAAVFDVQFAIVVMAIPNLMTNSWQAIQHWKSRPSGPFIWYFAGAGGLGVVAGSVVLATLSHTALSLVVSFSALTYVVFRFARPGWFVTFERARQLCIPAGFLGGMLQGSSGLSAPVSLSFLNAMRLDRPVFIVTLSVFFIALSIMQVVALGTLGILTPHSLAISAAAVIPILAFMPVGAKIAKRLPREVFDKVILAMLTLLAFKLAFDALA